MSRSAEREFPFLIGKIFSRNNRISNGNRVPITGAPVLGVSVVSDSDGQFLNHTLEEPQNNRGLLIERWKKLPRRLEPYPEGSYPNGTKYPAGQTLFIGDEQVMDTFESQWCMQTADRMFEGKRGPLTVVMRGFGMGITEEYVSYHIKVTGGTVILIDLNHEEAQAARSFATKKNREVQKMPYPHARIEFIVMEGDADEELAKLPDDSIDLLFSDTHQLQPSELGINDILQPDLLVRKLKPDGRLSICAFHRGNQTGYPDDEQRQILAPMFKEVRISQAQVVVPEHCTYLTGPTKLLPVTIAIEPVKII